MSLMSIFITLALIGSLITVYEHFVKREENGNFTPASGLDNNPEEGTRLDERVIGGQQDELPILGLTRKPNELPAWLERYKPFFNCFCVLTNGAKLLDTSSSESQLPCLHGIRFLSLSWVILCHAYSIGVDGIRDMLQIIPAVDHWPFQIVMNGFYSVDSFFLLSGFLLAYLFFEVASKNNGKVPWLYFYIHRYIRLTPVYMIVLGFYAAVLPYMGSGPLWPVDEVDPGCTKNWWQNLLYINNLFDYEDICMGWSWYLANDMQFFVISPLFLIALWRYPVVGYAILAFFLNATTTTIFVLSYQDQLVAGMADILETDDPQNFREVTFMKYNYILYVKPYARIGPYIIGIALAYYLYKRRQNNCGKNSVVTLSCGWFVASTITLACLFGLYHRDMSLLEISVYNAFSRTCFAGGVAWVIYVCVTGQGGLVNRFLSFKLFVPLSRLTYCAYLGHYIIIYLYYLSLKSLFDFSHLTMVILYLGFLVASYGSDYLIDIRISSHKVGQTCQK